MTNLVEEVRAVYDNLQKFDGRNIRDFLREVDVKLDELEIEKNFGVGASMAEFEDPEYKAKYLLGQLRGAADWDAPPYGLVVLVQTFEGFALELFRQVDNKEEESHEVPD